MTGTQSNTFIDNSKNNGDFIYQYDENDRLRDNRPIEVAKKETKLSAETPRIDSREKSAHAQPKIASSLNDYEVVATIGTGSYGTCKKIRRKKDGKVLVWKEMDYGTMTESEKQMLVSEVNLLRELRHQHIVRYYDRVIDRSKAVIYVIMEYCEGGDLAAIIAKNRKETSYVSEEFVWKILIQTTHALKECHRRKNGKAVLHRDLKPANVFLDASSNVKLGDFGLARVLNHESSFAQTYVGTPYYMSPELVNNMSYNEKSDIWALGCMVYELCALAPPFTASNQTELNAKIRVGDFPRLPRRYSSELDMIIRKMIQVEVAKRPSIDAILADSVVKRKQDEVCKSSGEIRYKQQEKQTIDPEPPRPNGDDLQAKMKQLELKEKELESRERSIALREKLAEEKMKRAVELFDQCRRRSEGNIGLSTTVSPVEDIAQTVSQHTCLSKGRKEPDSPKKQVTFEDYLSGKENSRLKSVGLSGLMYNSYTGLYSKDKSYLSSMDKDLFYHGLDLRRDRLYSAPSAGVSRSKSDVKYLSRNLLYFR